MPEYPGIILEGKLGEQRIYRLGIHVCDNHGNGCKDRNPPFCQAPLPDSAEADLPILPGSFHPPFTAVTAEEEASAIYSFTVCTNMRNLLLPSFSHYHSYHHNNHHHNYHHSYHHHSYHHYPTSTSQTTLTAARSADDEACHVIIEG
ncbi:hypothetical protein ACOMHN_016391 [Nucella lapillus]